MLILIKGLLLVFLQFFMFAGIYELGYYLIGSPRIWGLRVVIDFLLWGNLIGFIINAVISLMIIKKDLSRTKLVFRINCMFFLLELLLYFLFLNLGFKNNISAVIGFSLLISYLLPSLWLFIKQNQ